MALRGKVKAGPAPVIVIDHLEQMRTEILHPTRAVNEAMLLGDGNAGVESALSFPAVQSRRIDPAPLC